MVINGRHIFSCAALTEYMEAADEKQARDGIDTISQMVCWSTSASARQRSNKLLEEAIGMYERRFGEWLPF